MRKIIFILLFVTAFSFAQNRKGGLHLQKGSNLHRLYVSFKTDIPKYDIGGINTILPGFTELAGKYGITAKKAITISDAKLDEMEQRAKNLTGNATSVTKLRNIVELSIDNPINERLLGLAQALEKYDAVEYTNLTSAVPIAPPGDILPLTPSGEEFQGYIGSDGVKMDFAWQMGLTGEGINIRDIEYGFNAEHEEFNENNMAIAPGMEVSPEATAGGYAPHHGTAVLGIMYAHKGNYGVSGMAYGANEVVLFPEWQPNIMGGYNRITAVTQCLENSTAGDIVVYEMQAYGQEGGFVPAEYDQVVWDLTKAASDAGVIIVAAAGNGNVDLNSPYYYDYNNRGNSGAIIVGAGSPDNGHNRLQFSTYGDRVDLQGWGSGVYTTGYGDIIIGSDMNQAYTSGFSGTSSATPIVASCVVVLQSYYHQLTGNYLTGPQMRDLLKATGTPQGSLSLGNIGPLPDMENAVAGVAALVSTQNFDQLKFTVSPNPVQDKLAVAAKGLSSFAKVAVYTTLGQLIYTAPLEASSSQIDFSRLPRGIYIVKVTDAEKVFTKKVVKK